MQILHLGFKADFFTPARSEEGGSPRHGWGKGVGRKPVFVRIEKSKTGGVGKVKSVKDEASLGEAGARPTPSGWPPEKAEMNKRPPTSHPVHIPHPPTPTPATRW